nr:hypothetical protein GCM10020093_097740 [Planobispora longispora]
MLIQAAEARPDPARHLALAVQTARENLAEARALVAALSPAPLDGSSFDEALRRLVARLGEETGISAAVSVRGRRGRCRRPSRWCSSAPSRRPWPTCASTRRRAWSRSRPPTTPTR